MSLQFTVCFAEGNEDKANEPVGMPNPVVEYDSLDEINAMVGVNLIRPAAEKGCRRITEFNMDRNKRGL